LRQLIHLIFLLSCFAWFTGCETPQSGSGSASTGGGADSFQVQDNPLLTNVSRGEDVGKNLNRLMEGPTVDHCPNCPIPDSQPEASGARVNDSTLMSNYTKLGGDPVALEQALCFANKYKRTKEIPSPLNKLYVLPINTKEQNSKPLVKVIPMVLESIINAISRSMI